jgi:hypothetical protein
MRVNITYGVELEDIPGEIKEKLNECLISLQGAQAALGDTINKDPLGTLGSLEEIRSQLLSTDLAISDCMGILSGYVNVKSKLSAPQQEHIEMEGIDENGTL